MHTGSILIIVSLVLTALNLLFLAQSAGGNLFAKITARRIHYLISLIIGFTFILLLQAFISNDFSIGYVYQNSSLDLPLMYKISAVWAGKEGGFLLWLLFLCIVGIAVIWTNDRYENILLSVLTLAQFFILISLTINSPFARIWETHSGQFSHLMPQVPDGLGLNPLLQDFWMAVHPPVLFAGYAASVVPFAYAVAALLKNDYDIMPLRAYRWVLFSAAALGSGIFLGGYWAYAVLGWGGYWGWDPVENSSLIPWLLLIALLHGLIVQRRKGALVRTNCAIAMLQFLLVLYSTFLTRSGILSEFSVHSFSGESVSYQILYYLMFFMCIAIALFALRFKSCRTSPLEQKSLTQENLLVFGILILLLYAGMIFIGTSMPIFTKLLSRQPSTVTEEFYAIWSVPAGMMVLCFIGLVTFSRGKKFETKAFILILIVSIIIGILFNLFHTAIPSAYLLTIASFFALISVCRDWYFRRSKAHRPSRIVHAATALLVIGIIASTYHSLSIQKNLQKDVETLSGGIALKFLGLTEEEKPHLRLLVSSGRFSREIRAAYYHSERTGSLYKEPAISHGFRNDIYIAPVSYATGRDLASMIMVKKGDTGKIGDTEVTYIGLKDTSRKAMREGMPEVFVDIQVVHQASSYRLSPGFRMDENGHIMHIDAFFSPQKRKVSLKNLNPETKEALLFIEPSPAVSIPPDELIVEISYKRLVILVWLGTALIALGLFLAFWRVKK